MKDNRLGSPCKASALDNIGLLWEDFEVHPRLEKLSIISDAYRDIREDSFADCLQWCVTEHRIPRRDWRDTHESLYEEGYGWGTRFLYDYNREQNKFAWILPANLFTAYIRRETFKWRYIRYEFMPATWKTEDPHPAGDLDSHNTRKPPVESYNILKNMPTFAYAYLYLCNFWIVR